MNGGDHLAAFHAWQQLVLFAFFAIGSLSLIAAGTYAGNADIWDKLGAEMKSFSTATKAIIRAVRMMPALLAHTIQDAIYRMQARHIEAEAEYVGRHRLA